MAVKSASGRPRARVSAEVDSLSGLRYSKGMTFAPLPSPSRYFPFEKGVYEVAPALKTFGTAFGNGELDAQVFQFDSDFPVFRASKEACRADRLSKYYREHEHSPAVARGIAALILDRLTRESPQYFRRESLSGGGTALVCALTGETLRFDAELNLAPGSPYESAFDALAMQVAEDLNVITLAPDGRNWLSAIHVCSPSTWRPEEKVGRDFVGIHCPVPHSEAMQKASRGIVGAMVNKGPYVRFNWGLTGNPRPNHYPDPPPGVSREEWRGRPVLDCLRDGADAYMWVERQIVWGCPEAQASLFTIRVSFVNLKDVRANPVRAGQLRSTLLSMSPALLEYKGFDAFRDELLAWLGA